MSQENPLLLTPTAGEAVTVFVTRQFIEQNYMLIGLRLVNRLRP